MDTVIATSSSAASQAAAVFIDGESGTVGLDIRRRLADTPEVKVVSLAPEQRKDAAARKQMIAKADFAILCLPDDAAREVAGWADEIGAGAARLIDASTAHRVAPGWTYGFPELAPDQPAAIRASNRVANPGCYPTGGIALLRPLVDAGVMPADYPVTVNAVSGYSGGGKSMINDFESGSAPSFKLYGLGFNHKHVPELQKYSGLTRTPIFVPSVGNFRQGMLVSVPLHLDTLTGKPKAADLHDILAKRYAGSALVSVHPTEGEIEIEPESLNNTDKLELRVYASEAKRQAVLVAKLDNLGKGAAGAAVQNLKVMLGLL